MNKHELIMSVKDILIPWVKRPLPPYFTRVSLKDLGLCIEDIPLLFEEIEQRLGVYFDDNYITRCLDREISVSNVIDELNEKIKRKL
jgi:hypothetical protein